MYERGAFPPARAYGKVKRKRIKIIFMTKKKIGKKP